MSCPKCNSENVQKENQFSICADCGHEFNLIKEPDRSPYYVRPNGDLCLTYNNGNVSKVIGVQETFVIGKLVFKHKLLRFGT